MATGKTSNMGMNSWGTSETVKPSELNANFAALDNELGARGLDIRWKGADASGAAGSYNALLAAVNDTAATGIFVPPGVYLIEKSIAIPANKRLEFARGARLKPAKGITITVNGTIAASLYDWIFDISAGGVIAGTPKVGDIYPTWFGAAGDGVTDDTAAFQAAMALCNKKFRIFIPVGKYRIRQTITNNSRGMYGAATFLDDGQSGSLLLWDPIDTKTDLLPCIRIENAGIDANFEDFGIYGQVAYNTANLATWVNKSLYDQSQYTMFAAGTAAIEVAGGARPILRCVATRQVKVGLLLNSTDGHVTSYDCSWNGLIGMYCMRNSEDYFIQGGMVSGAFCGLMIGVKEHAGHYGGMAVTLQRVHMGYSPYGIYQVIDAASVPDVVNGIYGTLESVRFEYVGEAAIKLLPASLSAGLSISGFGMSWSTLNSSATEFALPDALKARNTKQSFAVYFGTVANCDFKDIEGTVMLSGAPGQLGTAYIEYLGDDVILSGLQPDYCVIAERYIDTSLQYSTPLLVGQSIRAKANNPLGHGNLIQNPELLKSWTATGAALSMVTNLATLPVPFSAEMKTYVDKSMTAVLKISPNGNSPYVAIPFNPVPLSVDTNRYIAFEYFILSPQARCRSRLEFGSSMTLYDFTFDVTVNQWTKITCNEQYAPNANAYSASFFDLSPSAPTYIAAVMVSYDYNAAYSPYGHAYSKAAIESGDAFILTDKTTGARGRIELVNGKLQVTMLPG
ncbi:pectate lyase-like protein [Paenibacillus sp. BK033]|uniref:glycosyl hydrolase family 28-related protein n=1 Tax=Paenibacillus sp. BK033 TaxID=2512133 RepID=UPI0010522614|nr:glycosyl hydrolase family 28-related protein [Paenibacillus sp. BK033]TCN00633.1 pectate lyase-like protein [Paenibacillus sp. BK033]